MYILETGIKFILLDVYSNLGYHQTLFVMKFIENLWQMRINWMDGYYQ